MLAEKTIGIIGAGQMGEAIIAGLLRQKLITAQQVTASTPRLERREELEKSYGIATTADNTRAADCDIVVLAVKPQNMAKVVAEVQGSLRSDGIVISIAAGINLQKLHAMLRSYGTGIVRAMPNTPGKIGRGITVWTAMDCRLDAQRTALVHQVLGALGETVFVAEDKYMDMATALSGTGPAYVFLFIEELIAAGVRMGLPRHTARQLVMATVSGSAAYATQSDSHLAALRDSVTSPGGTTAEALAVLEHLGFRHALMEAVIAAWRRCMKLGK